MMKRISLMGRKRTRELGEDSVEVTELKKEQLLSMKLDSLNKTAKATGTLIQINTSEIIADKNQPRKTFINIDLLANSIQQQGIIQPIIVKKSKRQDAGKYIIIAGERRFLAAKKAQIETVPCILREENDANTILIQLLENSQREQVAPIEEAESIQKLIKEMKLSKSEVAKELGQPASWISMRLSLLNASDKIKELIEKQKIEDFRTVHELRKLEEESPKEANIIINKINEDKLAGSYRAEIKRARTNNQLNKNINKNINTKLDQPIISNIEYKDEHLIINKGDDAIKFYISKGDFKNFIKKHQNIC